MKIHMVKSGDSMYTIAQKHGVDLDQLIAFNPQISNPDQIDVGMKVKIPTAALVHDGNSGVEYAHKHVVVQGDSLWKISKAWGLSLKEMVDANPQLKNPSVLLTGEIVNIPKQASHSVSPLMNPSDDYANMSGLGNAGALAPIMNTLSPENVPQLVSNIPQFSENISQLSDNIPQLVSEAPAEIPAQIPVSSPVKLPEAPPLLQMTLPAEKQPLEEKQEPKNESIEIASKNLFAQFNVPAMEVQAKPEQHESYQMPEFTETPQWPTSPPFPAEQPMAYISPYSGEQPMAYISPYSGEQPMVYAPPYGKEQQPTTYSAPYGEEQQPMTYASPYEYEQPMTDPYSSYYATEKAGCGCGCGGHKNVGPYMHTQPPYQTLPNYYMPYPMQPMQPMETMMPYPMEQPIPMPISMPMQQPMQQPIMEYPQWSPYAANAAFLPINMMYPTAELPYSFYGYMSPCYPIFPPAQIAYLHGKQEPYSPWVGPMSSSFKESEERMGDQSTQEQEQDLSKTSAIEVSPTKMKVQRKSSNRNSEALDDRMILHNFLQQKSTNHNDSFRESKSNEPWINR